MIGLTHWETGYLIVVILFLDFGSVFKPLIPFPTEGFWSNCGFMAFKEGFLPGSKLLNDQKQ